MLYVYKLQKGDKFNEFDVFKFLELSSNDGLWVFGELELDEFLEYSLLDMKECKSGEFAILDDDTKEIKLLKISIDLVVSEEAMREY